METTQAEEQDAAAASERNPEKDTLLVYTLKLPVPVDMGIEKDLLPTACQKDEPNLKGEMVSKSYYNCIFCDYSSQNQASSINHTC